MISYLFRFSKNASNIRFLDFASNPILYSTDMPSIDKAIPMRQWSSNGTRQHMKPKNDKRNSRNNNNKSISICVFKSYSYEHTSNADSEVYISLTFSMHAFLSEHWTYLWQYWTTALYGIDEIISVCCDKNVKPIIALCVYTWNTWKMSYNSAHCMHFEFCFRHDVNV